MNWNTTLCVTLLVASCVTAQEQVPELLGRDTHMWQDGVSDVRVLQNYLYLAQEHEGMRVLNVSDPLHPEEVTHLPDIDCEELEVEGTLLAARCLSDPTVIVFSLTNPASPELLTTLSPEIAISQIDLNQSRLAVWGYHTVGREIVDDLLLYDLSDPATPVVLAHYAGLFGFCYDLELNGDRLLVAAGNRGLICVDLSDLEHPVSQTVALPEGSGYAFGVLGFGEHACIGAGNGFYLVDLDTMQPVGSIEELYTAYQVRTDGELVYLSYGAEDCPVAAIDISDPTAPFVRSEYAPDFDVDFFCISGEFAYCAGQAYGVRVVSLEDPDNLHEVAYFSDHGDWDLYTVIDQYAVAFETAGLHVRDLSDLQQQHSVWQTACLHGRYPLQHNNLLFALSAYDLLVCLDMSNPESPVELSRIEVPEYNGGRMCVWNNCFVVPSEAGLLMYDIQDPANIFLADTLAGFDNYVVDLFTWQDMMVVHGGLTWDLHLVRMVEDEVQITTLLEEVYSDCRAFGNLLYLENWDAWRVADLSVLPDGPLEVQLVAGLENDYYGTSMALHGDFLYMASAVPERFRVHIYDNRNPVSPVLLGSIPTEYFARCLQATEDRLYVDQYYDLDIYDVSQLDVAIETPAVAPGGFELHACYPNPFNPSTTVSFTCPQAAKVELTVYNLLGKRITSLAHGDFNAGEHKISWNGRDTQGVNVASGTYFIVARFPDGSRAQTVTLLK